METTKCKICGHGVKAVYDRQFKKNYYLCNHCRFLFMDESKIPTAEREKAEYLTHQNTLDNDGYVNMLRTFTRKAIIPFQKKPDRGGTLKALDFGSGPGDCVLSHILREELGYDVDIYDVFFSPGKVYTDKTYDLITCTEVSEHLQNPLDTLTLLKNLLKPGGILALTTLFHPIDKENPGGEEMFQQWWYRRDVTHIGFFRPETFRFIARLLEMEILVMDERNTVSMRV